MATEFNYTKDPCNVGRLTREIQESAITIAIDQVNLLGSALTVVFKADLSSGEEDTLDALVTAHTGEPLPDESVQTVSITEKDSLDRILTAPAKKSGAAITVISHDFVNKTSWYQKSTRVEGEEPPNNSGLGFTYNLAHQNVIDLEHGLITGEDEISGYRVIVKKNGVVQTSGFTINYAAGTITFSSSQLGNTISVDYSYADDSTFILSPPSGGKMQVNRAEVQFTKNITMKKTIIEVWAYNPDDLPNKMAVPGTRRTFKSEKDVINISNSGKNKIEQFGSLPADVWEFPFDYESAILLDDSLGMELRVFTEDDENYTVPGGQSGFATIAFHGDPV